MQIILKYLDLGIWNWIIPKNKTIVLGYRKYSRMAVHRNLVERDLTIPLMTLALSGGACCFAIVFCMEYFLLVAFNGLLYSSAIKWSIHLDSNMSTEKSYISSMSLLATSRLNNDPTISWCFRVWVVWCLGWSNVPPKQTFLVTASAQGRNNEDSWFMLVPYICEPNPKKKVILQSLSTWEFLGLTLTLTHPQAIP